MICVRKESEETSEEMDTTRSNKQRILNLIRVRKTIREMLIDRGYNVDNLPEEITMEEATMKLNNMMFDILVKHGEEEHWMFVKFYTDAKSFGKKELQHVVETVREKYSDKELHFIILLSQDPTPPAKKEMENSPETYKYVEIQLADQYIFNITKHKLVPKHERLSAEEVQQVLIQFHCKKSELPKMLTTDPVSKYYAYQPGDVIRITRNQVPTTGSAIYYRVVR